MARTISIRLALTGFGLAALLAGCATAPTIKPDLAALPEPLTSFGAVTCDGSLYVFGGHKGERHDYSVEMVSGAFERLPLSDGRTWDKLPSAPAGQGLALAAHGHDLYRIGGMAARNHEGAKQDLYSLALVQKFDVAAGRWEDLPPLPAPRSSLDAVASGDKLYVVGGWQQRGGTNKAIWPSNALVLDLTHPEAGWREFPQPFRRRALALAALGSRIYCIGGMESDSKPTLAVDIYDTASGKWTKGPNLPDNDLKGFACSATAQNGKIYATTFQGVLLQLAPDGSSWEIAGKLEHPRIAHRLVAAGREQLIALGGEDGEENKTPGLELLTPARNPAPVKQTTSIETRTAATH